MNKTLLLCLTCVTFLAMHLNTAYADPPNPKGPIVVELFTSQSCSSCPPADKILSELSADKDIITLSCHVTYWNHLHWVDDLSHKACTDRQHQYAAYKNANRVYTPQMIVNGKSAFVGSKRRTALKKIKTEKPVALIKLTKIHEHKISANLPNLKKGEYTLKILGTQTPKTRDIKRGENKGKTITYSSPVKFIDKIGSWNGKAEQKGIVIKEKAHHYTVLAEDHRTGEILAAGKI